MKKSFFQDLTTTVKINRKGVNLTRRGNINVTKITKDGKNTLEVSVTPRRNNIRVCGYTISINGTRKINALKPLSSTEKKIATRNFKTLTFALTVTLVTKEGKAEKITNKFPENAIRVVAWDKKTGVVTTYTFSFKTQNGEVFMEACHVKSPCYRDTNNTLFCPCLNGYLPELVRFVSDNLAHSTEIENLKHISEYISDEIEAIARVIPDNTGVILRTFDPAFAYAEVMTNKGRAVANVRELVPTTTGNLTPTLKTGDTISFKMLGKTNLTNTDFFPRNWFTKLPKMEVLDISLIEKTPAASKKIC